MRRATRATAFVLAMTIAPPPIYAQGIKALLLFGGRDHKTYLGCLNCGSIDPASVCNAVGIYGSVVSSTSIWNVVGEYGSIVSDTSPWSIVATHPPAIVDKDGSFYGYFTANVAHAKRTQIPALVDLSLTTSTLDERRRAFCGGI